MSSTTPPEELPPSLASDVAWTTAGTAAYAASQWGILAAMAKVGGAAMVGRFSLATALAAPVFLFANLGLRAVLATDVSSRRPAGDYVTIRVISSGLALALCAVMSTAVSGAAAALVLVSLAKAVEAVSEILYGLFQKHRRMKLVSRSLWLRGPGALAATGAVLALTGDLAAALACQTVCWAAVLALHDVPQARALEPVHASRQWTQLRALALLTLPVGVAAVLNALSFHLPRYWLASSHGDAAVGIYSALVYLLVPGNLLISALCAAALPRLASLAEHRDRGAFRRLLAALIACAAGLGALGAVIVTTVGARVVGAVYRPEFATQMDACVVLVLGGACGFVAFIFDTALTATGRFHSQAVTTLGMLAVVGVLSALVVPGRGIYGAALATAGGMLAHMLFKGAVVLSIGSLAREIPSGDSFYRRHGKRWLDVTVAATGLALGAPLLGLLWMLVAARMGTPALFRQARPGRGARPFTLVKFRTMTSEVGADGALLPDGQRLTALGRFLRVTSLDELPELYNVLIGEMSLVGPRPLLMEYVDYYTDAERVRFDVPPGITGWAQVNGRNEVKWDERLALDAWYVAHCSLWLDLRILALTVVKVLRRDQVHADTSVVEVHLDVERRDRGAA